jgi:hypothetical protein
MFSAMLGQEMEHDLRFRRDHLAQEHPMPDAFQRIHWLQLLKQRFWPDEDPALAEPELFVPDDRLGVFVQDGIPLRLLLPGRHRFPRMKAKAELRLIPMDALRDPAPGDLLRHVQDLPCERVFQFLDGELVSTVKPASVITNSPLRSVDRRVLPAQPSAHGKVGAPSGADEDEDYAEGFSFV